MVENSNNYFKKEFQDGGFWTELSMPGLGSEKKMGERILPCHLGIVSAFRNVELQLLFANHSPDSDFYD
jgi:hypothetical protein